MGQFDNINLGRDMNRQLRLVRESMASNIEDMIEEGEITKELTVGELIELLRQGK